MERVSFKSGVWHKQCFNCANCKYTLTNTLDDVFDKNGQLYCRPCMKKHFADEFAKPTTISDTQKKIIAGKDEEKCPNCEGAVFPAEMVAFNGNVYHQSCFNCISCHFKLDSLNAQSISSKIFCKVCYKNALESKRSTTPMSMVVIDANDPTACPRCGCKVRLFVIEAAHFLGQRTRTSNYEI